MKLGAKVYGDLHLITKLNICICSFLMWYKNITQFKGIPASIFVKT